MAAVGLEQRELTQLAGSEARKVALARLLWENTTVSMQWIADHLRMKSAANASQQIRRSRREKRELPKALRRLVLSKNVA
jgi:ABC-type hemin transport system ATPase subunit